MFYVENAKGERIAVLRETYLGTDPETGEELFDTVIDDEATAELNNPKSRRERAYVAEADPIRDRAMSYRLEAEGWRLEGDEAKALEAEAKEQEALKAYVAIKEEIRTRYPDATYCLSSSGTYHRAGCSYVTESGEWLTLPGIASASPAAKPCSRCNPPPLS